MSDLSFKTLRDTDFQGKVVLVRFDYNVPLSNGEITSDLRIRASLPTLHYLLENGARKIIIISHLGKPKGEYKTELSLGPVARRLEELLNSDNPDDTSHISVEFCPENTGTTVQDAVENLPAHSILLLENLRFNPGEEANSPDFAAELAQATGAEVFVQDGFAVVHRAHASTSAITKHLPASAGLLVENEVDKLSKVLYNPEKPFVIIIGGAKVDDKSPLIERLAPQADRIFVGGKISADGYTTDDEKVDVATTFSTDTKLDVSTDWVKHLIQYLEEHQVKTVLWNGVLGMVEEPEFAAGSQMLAEYLGSHPEITSVICGGDTSGFVENLISTNSDLHFALISTGGGAALEFLSGAALSGLTALTTNYD